MDFGVIFGDFAKALGQLGDRAFLGVLLKALALTVALLAAAWVGVGWLASLLPDWGFSLPWIGSVSLHGATTGLAVVAMMGASAFLMFPVAAVFVGLFLDEIAAAVEARHYPHLPPAAGAGLAAGLVDALRFLGILAVANLLMLVIYLFAGPFAPVAFWLVNGFLLGREYFQMAALRRLRPEAAAALRRRHGGQVWLAGILMAVPLSVPVLNLVIPILGAATFTHLVRRLDAQRQPG